jgi:spermidine/putrescine transport system substrate-binding protein
MIDPVILARFEKETGIKVYLNYFESNEELFVKLKATQGSGYDLIIPTDYMMKQLIDHQLLKKIDRSKLYITERLNPKLLGLYFDPHNEYSLPYYWGVYGLGVDQRMLGDRLQKNTWGLLFDSSINPYKVAMINIPREALLLAAQYRYGSIDDLSLLRVQEIKKILIAQKKMVEVYADAMTEYYLISQTCPVIVTSTPLVWHTIKKYPYFEFILPKEGSFQIIDCLAISCATKKDEYIYKLINFLYSEEVIKHHFGVFTFFPATVDLPDLFEQYAVPKSIVEAHQSANLQFFKNVISEEKTNSIWLSVKAA